jgi:Ser/Thr protein kinase RdoA (MazF antagonist)
MQPTDVEKAAGAFGLGRVCGPASLAARGHQGVLWRLQTDHGVFAVKELIDPLTEQAAEVDAGFTAAMIGRGVHAPEPIRTADGAVLAEVGDARVRVSRWVDLHEPRTDLDPVVLGMLLGTLHRDPLPTPTPEPVDAWYVDPVPEPEWARVAQALVEAGAPFAIEFTASVPQFVELQDLFRPPAGTQLCHRDLWADNLRGTPSGRLCAIDWDNCGAAEPVGEVGMLLFEFCAPDPLRVQAFCRAYRATGGTTLPTEREDFTMVLAQFGHFAVSAGQDWLASTDDAERASAQAWFREGYDRPLGLPQIDALLSAVRSSL